MDEQLQQRLLKIEPKITAQEFLHNQGLGNEVGYYVFDYLPQYELAVREQVQSLAKKYDGKEGSLKIVLFDLYEIIIELLKERGYLEKCFTFEQTKGTAYTCEAISKMLRLTGTDNLIVNHILQHTPKENAVVFLTGVGKAFPLVRSHNVLNNLHQVLDRVPVVLFFPGKYSGQSLSLYGTVKAEHYYRAFQLVD